MTENTPIVPSGDPANVDPVDPTPEPEPKPNAKDLVSYETHRKLLRERKTWQEKAEALEREARERAEKDLEENQKWKELAEHRAREAADAKEQYEKMESQLSEGRKLSAVLEALPADVPKKYWNLLDTSKIVFNPETGEVEDSSVQEAAKYIQENYSEILTTQRSPGQPANSPASPPAGGLTIEEWKKLPYDERVKPEVRARIQR